MIRSWLSRGGRRGKGYANERLETLLQPDSDVSEAYRNLRTNMLFSLADDAPKVIVLTSLGSGEGTGSVCANLAVTLAQADKNALIVDCDLRHPTIHELFDLTNSQGLAEVLASEHRLQAVWQEPLPGLKVLTAGPVPRNPADLLYSERFAAFLDRMRQQFDYVLVNAPPLSAFSDAIILANRGDGVLLLLDAQNVRKRSVWQAVHGLESVGAQVLGTVVYNIDRSRRSRRAWTGRL